MNHGEKMYADPRDAQETSHSCAQSVQDLRPTTRVHTSLWAVPHLFPRVSARRQDSWRSEVFLVSIPVEVGYDCK
jgi:hypothetical protein